MVISFEFLESNPANHGTQDMADHGRLTDLDFTEAAFVLRGGRRRDGVNGPLFADTPPYMYSFLLFLRDFL